MLKHKDERPQRDPGACVSWAQARWQRFTHTGLCKSGRRRPRAGSQPCRAMEAETRGALPASSPCRAAETRGPRGSRKQEQSSVLQKCISHCRARFSVCTLEQVTDGQWMPEELGHPGPIKELNLHISDRERDYLMTVCKYFKAKQRTSKQSSSWENSFYQMH